MSDRVLAVIVAVGLAATACADDDADPPPLETSSAPITAPAPGIVEHDAGRSPEEDLRPLEDQARDAGRRLLDTYVAPHGRVVRHDQVGDAVAIADAIHRHLTVPLGAGRLLVAGPWALEEQVWNPSYLSPLAFSVLYRLGDDPRWAEVASTGRVLLDRLTAEPPHLPPDWARLTDDGPVPHGESPVHGYDAVRTPWRLALDCDPHGVTLAARAWPLLAQLTEDGTRVPPAVLALDGSPRTVEGHAAATVGAAASAAAAGEADATRRLLALAEDQDRADPTYFGSALVALGRLGLDTDLRGTCP